jgi:hypothetical protein
MNSFTSLFRPWLLALAGLAAIELAYYAVVRPPRAAWNSFLDLQFAQPESFQRLVAYEKVLAFDNADADIIQVGDSSGLHGVQPPIVMSHIPGYNYLNLSVATNLGYSGYYNLARLQLERSRHARYLVIYASLVGGVPRRILWDEDQKLMAPLIYDEFMSPLHRLVQLPTLAARGSVTDHVYYMGYRSKQRDMPLFANRGYPAFMSVFRESNGWTRETDVEGDVPANIYKAILPGITVNQSADPNAIRAALRPIPRVTDEAFFDWRTVSRVSYFDRVYGAFADLAREHGVKLVLIFNPFPETSRRPEFEELMDWKAIEAGLKRVRERNPEVIVTRFDFWPDEKFSVFSHIGTVFSHESSHRVGEIMKGIIGNERPAERARAGSSAPRPAPVEIDFDRPYCGYGWTDQEGTTNMFPLQYVGPRNKAWIYVALAPGSAYRVRSVFRADDPELARRIELRVNGIAARKLDAGRSGDELYAEYLVPEETVTMYRGWMTLELDLGGTPIQDAQGKRSVLFRRITAVPAAIH